MRRVKLKREAVRLTGTRLGEYSTRKLKRSSISNSVKFGFSISIATAVYCNGIVSGNCCSDGYRAYD